MSSIAADSPRVEILVFDGCPNAEPTRELVGRVARELAIEPEIRVVLVSDPKAAQSARFLGSPTVRVDGHDVEPDAGPRTDFAFSPAASTAPPTASRGSQTRRGWCAKP